MLRHPAASRVLVVHTANGRRVVVDTSEAGAGAALPANLRAGDQVRVDGRWHSNQGQGGQALPPGMEELADIGVSDCLNSKQCMRAQSVVRSGGRAGDGGRPGACAVPVS